MKVELLCYGALMSNCWVIVSGDEALLVDSGAELSEIEAALSSKDLTLRGVLLTHGHFDHAMHARAVADRYGVPLYIHSDDGEMLSNGMKNAYLMCYGRDKDLGQADVLLHDGDIISLGGEEIKVLHTPGHSQGSVCYLAGKSLISGDTLFATSVGRWDLYGGSVDELRSSLFALTLLDENIKIYPGHGAPARLGDALAIALNLI
jgi:glyoxylase-like metal-dependent hydrolase (beta-lactamase superfamily II)